MTHAPETGAINRLHFGAGFWYVCHANLELDSSGTRFRRRLEHCSIPSWLIPFQLSFGYNTRCNNTGPLGEFVVYVAFSRVNIRCQKFSLQTYMVRKTGAENRRQKMEPIYGSNFWSVHVLYGDKILRRHQVWNCKWTLSVR